MAMYKLYAGLGGATYYDTEEFDTFAEAEQEAYNLAVKEYRSYEGLHGILSESDIREQYCEENGLSEDELTATHEFDISEMYQEEIESWIAYHVKEVDNDNEQEEE